MMRALLFRHPLLNHYAENLNVAMSWAAEVARNQGLSPDDAATRLKLAMLYDDLGTDRQDVLEETRA